MGFSTKPSSELGGTPMTMKTPSHHLILSHMISYYPTLTYTWWFIPLTKWVITLVISGLTPLIPFITMVITHLRFVGWTTKYYPLSFMETPMEFRGPLWKLSPQVRLLTPGEAMSAALDDDDGSGSDVGTKKLAVDLEAPQGRLRCPRWRFGFMWFF